MKLDVSLPVRARPIDWVIVFALAVAMVALHLLVSTQPRFSDADDAMHMVTAQSLADGQGWYDTTSYRENTPFGAPIHFSRLVDAPLALLITAFRPFVGAGASDLAALVWPLLLIPALFALCFALCRRLIPDADAVFVSLSLALSVVMYVEFSPGRVDHHNLQILATGALALATMVGRDNIRWAVAAGLLATLSLGIGAETAHLVAFATAVFGAYWAFGAAPARHVVAFALSLGLSSLALFLATIPPAAWLASACDAFSMSYLVAFVTAAAALIVATMFDRRVTGRIGRLALVGGSGVVALGVTLLASPACLHGAYTAVDPNLMKAFLLTVLDAQPASYLIAHQPLTALAFIVIPMLELLLGLYILAITKGPRRLDWAVLLGFFAVGMAVTLLQTRGIRVTAIYGVPVAAWLIHAAQKHHAAVRTVPALLLFSVSWLPFAGLVQVLVAATVLDAVAAPSPGDARCILKPTFDRLAAMPPSRVMAPIIVASSVLYFTDHTVVGTGFHRDTEGLADNVKFYSGTETEARAIADRRGLDLVVTCNGFHEVPPLEGPAPDSLNAGAHWDWLERVSPPGEVLEIYRIKR